MQPPEENYGTVNADTDGERLTGAAEQYAREEPMRAVGIAFVIGIILTLLPFGAIIGGIVRLIFSLLRPALLVLGAMKVYEEIERRQTNS